MSTDLLTLSCDVDIQAAAADGNKPATVDILAYSGGVMTVAGWGAVAIQLDGLEIPNQIPLLADHDSHLHHLVGQGTPTVEAGKLRVQGTLTAATDAGRTVIELGRSGISLQASVGVHPEKRKYIPPTDTALVNGKSLSHAEGFTLISSGSLREVSLLALGADHTTAVSISAKLKGQNAMSHDPNNSPDSPVALERARIRSIGTRLDQLQAGIVGTMLPDRLSALKASAVDEGWTTDKLEAEAIRLERDAYQLREIRAERPTGPAIHGSSQDASPKTLEASALIHLGREDLAVAHLGEQAADAGRRSGCHTILDLCRAALQCDHIAPPSGRDDLIRAAFSTTSLPRILSDAAHKVSLDAFQALPSVARVVAKRLSAQNFKTHHGLRLTGDSVFQEIGAAGEIKHGVLGEDDYTFKIATHARQFTLTRQNVIDDDMGKFAEIPQLLGRGAALAVEGAFWTLVLANVDDYFHDDNGNLIGDVLDIDGLGAGVTKLLQQVDSDGHPISVVPRYLVVPPELKVKADELYRSTQVVAGGGSSADRQPSANVFFGLAEPMASPYLSNESFTGHSATAWYLFSRPQDVGAFGLAYLSGRETPIIEQVDLPSHVLGIGFRGYLDFGVCQVDPKAALKSTGDD